MSDYMRIKYAAAETEPGGIHMWKVLGDGETEYLFACDEVCDGGNCIGPDDISSERAISVRDVEVERKGDTVTVNLIDVAEEPDE